MDALKKFLKKKSDKGDKKFKNAGPGHRLTDTNASLGNVTTSGPVAVSPGRKVSPKPPARVGPTAAGAAALARLEQKKSTTKPDDLVANRQIKFIREQARKQIEAEKKAEEGAKDDGGQVAKGQVSRTDDAYTVRGETGHEVDPKHFAVTGVFYCCPIVGPAVASRDEIEATIYTFLNSQLQDDLGVTSVLMILSCNPRHKVQPCVETLCKYLDNLVSHPTDPKFRKIRCSNRVFQEKVSGVKGVTEFLEAAGFTKQVLKPKEDETEEEFWVYDPPSEENEEQGVASLTELRDSLLSTTPIKPELDRNIQVLMPAEVSSRRELPPEFYQLTGDELKRAQQRRTDIAEKETQLRTKAQRDREDQRELRVYKFCLMRIRFPDGFTLQGTFHSNEKLGDVYAFVQESLAIPDLIFSLKRPGLGGSEWLNDLDASLAELRLPPASILTFKLDGDLDKAPDASFLNPDLLALVQHLE